jgi:hypothetical protein
MLGAAASAGMTAPQPAPQPAHSHSPQNTSQNTSRNHPHDFDVQKELHRRIRNDPDYDDWEYGTEPLPHEAWVKRQGVDRPRGDSGA